MRKPEFSDEEIKCIREAFAYTDRDVDGEKRIFMDNAGGSLRLKKASEAFLKADSIPDCSEHSNRVARYLAEIEEQGKKDILEVIFGAESGVIFPGATASQLMMEICRVFAENAVGTNVVTTILEHPSAYDAMEYYAKKYGREFRVAGANKESGGVDPESVLALVDKSTAVLCCMAASNISGSILDVGNIFREARRINPDILIICDAVQHAPHAWLSPEETGADAMTFAPYKFFGIRGFAAAWLSDRAASFDHHRLQGKPQNEWELGSPAPGHYAAITEIVNYAADLAKTTGQSRKEQFREGMNRIARHERYLMDLLLNGTEKVKGLRGIEDLIVRMDGAPFEQRDLILGIEFENMPCAGARAFYDRLGVVVFERSAESIYSKRMVEACDSEGMVRISPIHVNTKEEIEEFLKITLSMSHVCLM